MTYRQHTVRQKNCDINLILVHGGYTMYLGLPFTYLIIYLLSSINTKTVKHTEQKDTTYAKSCCNKYTIKTP